MDALREYKAKQGTTYDEAIQELLAQAQTDNATTTLHDRVDTLEAELEKEREERQDLTDRFNQLVDKLIEYDVLRQA